MLHCQLNWKPVTIVLILSHVSVNDVMSRYHVWQQFTLQLLYASAFANYTYRKYCRFLVKDLNNLAKYVQLVHRRLNRPEAQVL